MLTMARSLSAALLIALALAAGARAQSDAFPPGSFDDNLAERALQGDPASIWTFVDWVETPQGYGYWYAEAEKMGAGQPLSDEAASVIGDWVAVARAAAQSDAPPSFAADAAQAALAGDVEAVRAFVDWTETPQGGLYWAAQYNYARDGLGLTPLAQRTIANWIGKAAQ